MAPTTFDFLSLGPDRFVELVEAVAKKIVSTEIRRLEHPADQTVHAQYYFKGEALSWPKSQQNVVIVIKVGFDESWRHIHSAESLLSYRVPRSQQNASVSNNVVVVPFSTHPKELFQQIGDNVEQSLRNVHLWDAAFLTKQLLEHLDLANKFFPDQPRPDAASTPTPRILFAKTGWSEFYAGRPGDEPKGAAGYLAKEIGNETYNFKPYQGSLLGFFQPPSPGEKINLGRIEPGAQEKSKLDDVLLLWLAVNPEKGGLHLVGWYERAQVFSRPLQRPDDKDMYYMARTEVENAVLLPLEERFPIQAPLEEEETPSKEGLPGMSAVFYPYESNGTHRQGSAAKYAWIDRVLEFVRDYKKKNLLDENLELAQAAEEFEGVFIRGMGGELVPDFLKKGEARIGWPLEEDLMNFDEWDDLWDAVADIYQEPGVSNGAITKWTNFLWRFSREINPGTKVVTVRWQEGEYYYYLGEVKGAYFHDPKNADYPYVLPVSWNPKGIPRNLLPEATKGALQNRNTLFDVDQHSWLALAAFVSQTENRDDKSKASTQAPGEEGDDDRDAKSILKSDQTENSIASTDASPSPKVNVESLESKENKIKAPSLDSAQAVTGSNTIEATSKSEAKPKIPEPKTAPPPQPEPTARIEEEEAGLKRAGLTAFNKDALGATEDVELFATLLPQIQDPAVIGLFGQWGRGKTLFYRLLCERIKGDKSLSDQYHWMPFNAWLYQETPATWAYLYNEMLKEYLLIRKIDKGDEKLYPARPRPIWWHSFWRKIKLLSWGSIVSLLIMIFTFFGELGYIICSQTYLDWSKLSQWPHLLSFGVLGATWSSSRGSLVKLFGKTISKIKEDLKIKDFENVLGLQSEIQEEMAKLLNKWFGKKNDKKLLLYVDDLDRCDETKIVQVIDAIRLMMEHPDIQNRVVVMVGIDERLLLHAVECKYRKMLAESPEAGKKPRITASSLAREYLDKLFVFSLKLRPLQTKDYSNLLNTYRSQLNSRDGAGILKAAEKLESYAGATDSGVISNLLETIAYIWSDLCLLVDQNFNLEDPTQHKQLAYKLQQEGYKDHAKAVSPLVSAFQTLVQTGQPATASTADDQKTSSKSKTSPPRPKRSGLDYDEQGEETYLESGAELFNLPSLVLNLSENKFLEALQTSLGSAPPRQRKSFLYKYFFGRAKLQGLEETKRKVDLKKKEALAGLLALACNPDTAEKTLEWIEQPWDQAVPWNDRIDELVVKLESVTHPIKLDLENIKPGLQGGDSSLIEILQTLVSY